MEKARVYQPELETSHLTILSVQAIVLNMLENDIKIGVYFFLSVLLSLPHLRQSSLFGNSFHHITFLNPWQLFRIERFICA